MIGSFCKNPGSEILCTTPNYHGGSVFDFRFQQDWSVYVLVLQRSLRFGRLLGTVGSCFFTNVMNGIQECDLYKEPMFSCINKFPIPYHLYNFNFPTIFLFHRLDTFAMSSLNLFDEMPEPKSLYLFDKTLTFFLPFIFKM